VTADGVVKLVDFGIAKLIAEDMDSPADRPVTRPGERVLTVPYAAPEQLTGQAITTATDVYALGIVLYELLTGRRPHEAAAHDAQGTERAILEREAERPSSAIASSADGAAAARSMRPDRLRRRLAGDLDTICLMALRKEPARRYQSAGQFVDD